MYLRTLLKINKVPIYYYSESRVGLQVPGFTVYLFLCSFRLQACRSVGPGPLNSYMFVSLFPNRYRLYRALGAPVRCRVGTWRVRDRASRLLGVVEVMH